MNATWARQCLIKVYALVYATVRWQAFAYSVDMLRYPSPLTLHDGVHVPRLHRHVLGMTTNTGLLGQDSKVSPSVFAVEEWRLGLWVWRSQKRNVIPTSSDQRRTAVLFSIHQRLWKGFAFALREKQDGENRQQGQRRVDHMVQKVAVVITQIHERRTEAAHATQSHDRSHTTPSVDTRMEH